MSLFKKAVRTTSKLRLAIAGPPSSGKTYTALALASRLAAGAPIALVDTERGSASKYARTARHPELFDFDVVEFSPPFHPDKFIDAIRDAQGAGYAVIILDSLSHAWSGTGGVLDIVDEAAKRRQSGNSYTAWKEGTPVQNKLIDAITQAGLHVIVTMRSKTEYVLEPDRNGKQAPRKVGMAPVQRDQIEYEFDIVLDMDVEHNAIVSKTRCPELSSRVFAKPGAELAGLIGDWLSDGAPAPDLWPDVADLAEQAKALADFAELGARLYGDQWAQVARHNVERISAGKTHDPAQLTVAEILRLIDGLKSLQRNRATKQAPPVAASKAPPGTPITQPGLNTLNALGNTLYGSLWDEQRPALVLTVTKGAESSSKNLTANEGAEAIAELERRARAEYAELAGVLDGAGQSGPSVDATTLAGVDLAHALKAIRERSEQLEAQLA